MDCCCLTKYFPLILPILPTKATITTITKNTSAVSTGLKISIPVITAINVMDELISWGKALLSISRMVSVSLVNRDIISPCVRES